MALVTYAPIRRSGEQIGAIRLDHAGNPECYVLFGNEEQYVKTLSEFIELPGVFEANNFELSMDIDLSRVDVPDEFFPENISDPFTGEKETYLISEDPHRVIYFK